MAGRATVTTEPSMKAMLEPRMVAAKTHGRARSAQPDVSAAARMTPSSQGARPKLIIGCLVPRLPKPCGQHGDLAARPQNPASPSWIFAHVKSFAFYEIARGTPGIPGAH